MAVKVYSKDRTSASKLRAIKREAAMMVYLSKKRCDGGRHPARVLLTLLSARRHGGNELRLLLNDVPPPGGSLPQLTNCS